MGQKLCEACKLWGKGVTNDPARHCHHFNTENPKERCWCEYSMEERNNYNVSVKDVDGVPTYVWSITYCPVCGRKRGTKCHSVLT